jgi:hypothetical protein
MSAGARVFLTLRALLPGRADGAARVLLTLGALLPYWRLLTFGVIFVTDDYFASDIFNGELPGRFLMGQMLRRGELPVWTNRLCSGMPIAGGPLDPIGLGPFVLFSPAVALDLLVIVLLLVAAHGAYGLSRRFGADRTGSVLAGLAFAGSGYIACQLKHLGIVATIVWLPVALSLLDRTLDAKPTTLARRALYMGLFGLVLAEQALSGFPQSFYYCALVYGSFVLFRAIGNRRELGPLSTWLALLGGIAAVTALGAAAGAVALIPLSHFGSVSDRAEALGYEWSTRLAYWPPNILTFFAPYIHGDISDNSYSGPPFFWEDYGYVGLATVLLAIYASVRARRRPVVRFTMAMTIVAYLFVLGAATPVFHVAYLLIPGMKTFRFPTRFLIVVELGIALLGAIGLTELRAALARFLDSPSRVPWLAAGSALRRDAPLIITVAICTVTALDLFIHQPRQNPMVPAREWLAPPPAVDVLRADAAQPRTFTPWSRNLHRRTFLAADGWANVQPYFELRDVLQPNLGGALWNIASGDCYAGISARWYVDVWGDHSREAAPVALMAYLDFDAKLLKYHPVFPRFLRTFGVTHVLSPYPQQNESLPLVQHAGHAYIYRVDGASRVRFVSGGRAVRTEQEGIARLLAPDFDPDREIVLHDAPFSAARPAVGEAADLSPPARPARTSVTRENSREVVIDTEVPQDGFLLLADTFYPGWSAQVDGRPVPIYRANVMVRGIQLPKGRHEVRFSYDPPGFAVGLRITLLSLSLLGLWTAVAVYVDRRPRR